MEPKTVENLFSPRGVKYRIPIYQRRYVWEDNNWRHLWTDIEAVVKNVSEAKHFTGVIVIRDEANTLEIVDGQQRLTTFQIFVRSEIFVKALAIRTLPLKRIGSYGI